MPVYNDNPIDHGKARVESVDWKSWIDLEAGSRHEEQRHLGRGNWSPSPGLSSGERPRRNSIPLTSLPIPKHAVLADGGRILDAQPQRSRSNSVPWSTISSLDEKLQSLNIHNAIITSSPFAEASRGVTALPQIATIVGDRLELVEETGPDITRQRTASRGSIRSLERYHNLRRPKLGVKKRGKFAQILFQFSIYLLLACIIYFLLVGVPLWKGACWWLWYSNSLFWIFAFHGPDH